MSKEEDKLSGEMKVAGIEKGIMIITVLQQWMTEISVLLRALQDSVTSVYLIDEKSYCFCLCCLRVPSYFVYCNIWRKKFLILKADTNRPNMAKPGWKCMLRQAPAGCFLSGEMIGKVPMQNKEALGRVCPGAMLAEKQENHSQWENRTDYMECNPSETKRNRKGEVRSSRTLVLLICFCDRFT